MAEITQTVVSWVKMAGNSKVYISSVQLYLFCIVRTSERLMINALHVDVIMDSGQIAYT